MEKKIKGLTAGSFDLLHAGHVMMLKEVRAQCDYLIVALQTDPTLDRPKKHKPIETVEERIIRLKGCKYVDQIVTYDREFDLYNLLLDLKPDIRFLGEDWKGKKFTGFELPIKVVFNSRKHDYSSSNLIERICSNYSNRS